MAKPINAKYQRTLRARTPTTTSCSDAILATTGRRERGWDYRWMWTIYWLCVSHMCTVNCRNKTKMKKNRILELEILNVWIAVNLINFMKVATRGETVCVVMSPIISIFIFIRILSFQWKQRESESLCISIIASHTQSELVNKHQK